MYLLQVDPNTGVAMYESDEIIKYLVGKYGMPLQYPAHFFLALFCITFLIMN